MVTKPKVKRTESRCRIRGLNRQFLLSQVPAALLLSHQHRLQRWVVCRISVVYQNCNAFWLQCFWFQFYLFTNICLQFIVGLLPRVVNWLAFCWELIECCRVYVLRSTFAHECCFELASMMIFCVAKGWCRNTGPLPTTSQKMLYISQGSVAICLRCSEVFTDKFKLITKLLPGLMVKEFWKPVVGIWWSRDKSIVAPFCLTVAQFLHCSVYIIIYILLLLSLDHQHHPVYV